MSKKSTNSDLDLATVAAAFGLAPDLCAHDLIACLQKRINDAHQTGITETWRSLHERSGRDGCSHTLGCYVNYHSKGPHLAGSCQACRAAKEAEQDVFETLEEEFRGELTIRLTRARLRELKKYHNALTWEDEEAADEDSGEEPAGDDESNEEEEEEE